MRPVICGHGTSAALAFLEQDCMQKEGLLGQKWEQLGGTQVMTLPLSPLRGQGRLFASENEDGCVSPAKAVCRLSAPQVTLLCGHAFQWHDWM